MITNEKYNEAVSVIQEYKQQLSGELIPTLTCICCKSNTVKPIQGSLLSPTEHDILNSVLWEGGTVSLISFGYGSQHDTDSFYIAVCDECFDYTPITGNLVLNRKELECKIKMASPNPNSELPNADSVEFGMWILGSDYIRADDTHWRRRGTDSFFTTQDLWQQFKDRRKDSNK